ncbi:hypothetical protein OQA88_12083 [Cercophora sp. LCS_1]
MDEQVPEHIYAHLANGVHDIRKLDVNGRMSDDLVSGGVDIQDAHGCAEESIEGFGAAMGSSVYTLSFEDNGGLPVYRRRFGTQNPATVHTKLGFLGSLIPLLPPLRVAWDIGLLLPVSIAFLCLCKD